MNWVFALGVTGAILIVEVGIAYLLGEMAINGLPVAKIVAFLIQLASAIWVGIDAAAIELRKYKGFISGNPGTLAVVCALLWIIVFPGYLQKRWKITHGKAELKPEFASQQQGIS